VKIPLLPKHLGQRLVGLFSGPVGLVIYKIALLAAAGVVLYGIVVSGPGFLLAFLVTSIIAAVWMDDIRKTIVDLWNAEFWGLEV